jgi:hypothetical protein
MPFFYVKVDIMTLASCFSLIYNKHKNSIMSEMKDSNAPAALDGNPQPMDQTEDNSMPSAQQQVIFCTSPGDYTVLLHTVISMAPLHSIGDGITIHPNCFK